LPVHIQPEDRGEGDGASGVSCGSMVTA
jgi:hypothetical protein